MNDQKRIYGMNTIRATNKNKESKRVKAWQNFMTCVVNEGVSSGLVHLDENEAGDLDTIKEYAFLLNRNLVQVTTREIPYHELSITAIMHLGEKACDDARKQYIATARGRLERKTGKYIQDIGGFYCRNAYIDMLADMDVTPLGFVKSGPFIPRIPWERIR